MVWSARTLGEPKEQSKKYSRSLQSPKPLVSSHHHCPTGDSHPKCMSWPRLTLGHRAPLRPGSRSEAQGDPKARHCSGTEGGSSCLGCGNQVSGSAEAGESTLLSTYKREEEQQQHRGIPVSFRIREEGPSAGERARKVWLGLSSETDSPRYPGTGGPGSLTLD